MSWMEWLARGGPLAVASASRSIDTAEKNGADAGVIRTLRQTLAQCESDHDVDSAWAIDAYASRLGAGGAYAVQTPADVAVQQGLDAAKAVKTAATGTELVLVAILVVGAVWTVSRA